MLRAIGTASTVSAPLPDRLDKEDPGGMARRNLRRCSKCAIELPEGGRRPCRY